MKANFSYHAFDRVSDRLSIAHDDLIEIINSGLNINVGQEKSTNRVHKLFYSDNDKSCFVVIQDIKTGTIITILPIDYHDNIAWVVSVELQNQAKFLITQKYNKIENIDCKSSVFKITANITDDYGVHKKNINIGSWPCIPYYYDISYLLKDRSFLKFIKERIKEKKIEFIDKNSFISLITIRVGSKGDPVSFDVNDFCA